MILNMNRMAPDFEEFVPQPGVRTVILSMYAHPRCTTIDSDQYGSCELLTNYLLEHGHSNMRFVAGPENSISSRFREAGWRDTLGRAHVDAAPMLRGDWSADSGYAMGERIAAEVLAGGSQAPTAVLAANDQMALGVTPRSRRGPVRARRRERGWYRRRTRGTCSSQSTDDAAI